MAGDPVILCVDIGTSSLKAALVDSGGRELAYARSAYGGGEVRAGDWEKALGLVVGELAGPGKNRRPDGICVSGNGPTMVSVDAGGESLRVLPWREAGGDPPVRGGVPGPSGDPLAYRDGASFFLPRIARFMAEEPEGYGKTALFLSSQEWLSFRLGAEAVTVLPQDAYIPYYWEEDQVRRRGIDMKKFPPYVKMGSIIGKVSREASARFPGGFIRPGVPLAAGPPDFIAALIGTGALEPGEVCDRGGTSEGINLCAASPPPAAEGFRALPHAREGCWNLGAVIPSSGKLFEDYRRETGQEGRPYAELLAELIPRRPGDEKGLPERTLQGRKVLRTMAAQVRTAVEGFARLGFVIRRMRLSGGQSKTGLWNQFKADLTGLTLMAGDIRDGELAGDAVLGLLALEGLGLEAMPRKAKELVRFSGVYTPRNSGPEAG
jgi:sugar (pentulose or hexulose) kinase